MRIKTAGNACFEQINFFIRGKKSNFIGNKLYDANSKSLTGSEVRMIRSGDLKLTDGSVSMS